MGKQKTIADGNSILHNIRRTFTERGNYMVNIICLFLLFLAGCEREVVPQHLIGIWKTSAPQYADRSLKIGEHILVYGVGNGEEISHTIVKIENKHAGGTTVSVFYYRDADGEQASLTVIYRPDAVGTLQIKNSEAVWEKTKDAEANAIGKTPI